MLNKKHNLKSEKKNKDKEKGFLRENKTGNRKKIKDWWKTLQLNILLSWHKSKKTEKQRDKNKEPKESKKERQEEERKKRTRERQRKKKLKRGEAKKG